MIRAVVFDLDNTLVDFMRMKNEAIEAAVHAMIDAGLSYSIEDIRAAVDRIYDAEGIEYQKVFNSVLEELLGEVDYKILASGIIAYRRSREATLVPYKHVYLTLHTLVRMGLKLGVVSDAPRLEAWLRLCHLNLHHTFDAVRTFEDSGERKPSPKPFQSILTALDVQPEETIMIGDWEERDMVGARNVGMRTAFAKYGNVHGIEQSSADYVLEDISDLIDIVRSLNGDGQ